MVIVFDLDEVVFNFVDPYIAWANMRQGTNFSRKDLVSYSFEDCGIIPKGANKKWVHDFAVEGGYADLPPMPNALKIIEELAHYHLIYYLTSRAEEFKEDTRNSLDRHDLWSTVLHASIDNPKGKLAKELSADKFIDDSPRFIKDVAQNSDAKTILFTNIEQSKKDTKGFYDAVAENWLELEPMLYKGYEFNENERTRG